VKGQKTFALQIPVSGKKINAVIDFMEKDGGLYYYSFSSVRKTQKGKFTFF